MVKMYVGEDVALKNIADIVAERRRNGAGGLTEKGEAAARKAAMRTGAGYTGVKFYTPAAVEVTGKYTSKDAQRVKAYTQLIISQGSDPAKSPAQEGAGKVVVVVEDVVDKAKSTLDPVGGWWETWKIPVTIGSIVIGGGLFLGYSGLGRPIGAAIGSKISKEDK